MLTKRDIVTAALGEIGLAAYVFDLQPEQLQAARRSLDAMMATWNGRGVRLAYPLDNDDLDTPIGVPDRAHEAMILGLAVRLAPSYGKAVAVETKANASAAYKSLLNHTPIERPIDAMAVPAGARNRGWDSDPFLVREQIGLTVGPDSLLGVE
jgi:hypothetical protein